MKLEYLSYWNCGCININVPWDIFFSLLLDSNFLFMQTLDIAFSPPENSTYKNEDSPMGRLFRITFFIKIFCMSISAQCLQELYMKWQAGVDICLFYNFIQNLSTHRSLIRCNNWGEKSIFQARISHTISKWLNLWTCIFRSTF